MGGIVSYSLAHYPHEALGEGNYASPHTHKYQ